MIELRDYHIEVALKYAEYKNNSVIFNNGYDKVPNPFTLKDANDFIKHQLKKKVAERKLIYWNNEFAGEIGITIKKDVFRLGAEIGYFVAEPFWGKRNCF